MSYPFKECIAFHEYPQCARDHCTEKDLWAQDGGNKREMEKAA